ncbi:MAG: class I SAM-dependent methyltransferase [bacterium]
MTPTAARCPLCGAADYAIVYDLTAPHSAEDVPGLVARCRACPMWFKILTDPAGLPTDYPGEAGTDDLAATYLLSDVARELFRRMLCEVPRTAGTTPRLLDVGAAQGALVDEATQLGFAAEGLDHSPSNVDAARRKGLAVRLGSAEDLDAQDAFDVVTLIDFIEHVPDPMRVLARVHRALKPGGELVVYTPNHRAAVVVLARLLDRLGVGYPVQEIFGRNHVCFFDDRSLPLALQRAGFAVHRQRQFRYDPRRPGQYISPLNLAAVTAVDWLGVPFGRVFRLLVHARKLPAA